MFTLPDLPYPYDALEPYIDRETMVIHHDKHHAAYVNNLNEALKSSSRLLGMEIGGLIKNINTVPGDIRTKARNNGGGHLNYSIFWQIMSPKGGGEPKGKLAGEVKKTFTEFKSFQEKFTQVAMGRFGSGWAWLVVGNKDLEIVDTSNQDSPISEGKFPILGLDV